MGKLWKIGFGNGRNLDLTKPLILWINDGFDGRFSFFSNWFWKFKREFTLIGEFKYTCTGRHFFPIFGLHWGHCFISSCIVFLELMGQS